jgi:hypothetical protein
MLIKRFHEFFDTYVLKFIKGILRFLRFSAKNDQNIRQIVGVKKLFLYSVPIVIDTTREFQKRPEYVKGQLISERNFGVFKSPKKPTKF